MARTDAPPTLPASLALGPVHLVVRDLDRSAPFYERAIGLQTSAREAGVARLGAGGEDLLVLHERADAPDPGPSAGLYHFALLHPSRRELARALQRLIESGTPVQGASDHGISEAIYLSDPDGNGIELAADQPRENWGNLRDPTTIGPRPLDVAALMETITGEAPPPTAGHDLRVGHLHLRVGSVDRALAFYRDVIGFEVQTLFSGAAFVAAGGYHHHLGLNTWRGEGVPAPAPGAVGLERWTIRIDPVALAELQARLGAAGLGTEDLAEGFLVRDPWGAALAVEPA